MKTVLTNTKRFLAMFLALALVILSVPESALAVKAAENSATITQNAANSEIITFTSGHALDGEVENGDIVSFTVAAADGYEDAVATGVTVTGAESVALTDDGEGTYSFAVSYTDEQKAGGVTYEIATTSSEVISASNQALGNAAAPVVTYNSSGTGITSVTVKKNGENGDPVSTAGSIDAADGLYVAVVFATGYECDDENTTYTIAGGSATSLTLTDGVGTIDSSAITDDITLAIAAKPIERTVTFDLTGAAAKDEEGTGDASATATITADYKFQIVPEEDTSLVSGVKYKIDNGDWTTTGLTKSGDVYTIGKANITGNLTITAKISDSITITYVPANPGDYAAAGIKAVAGKTNPEGWVPGTALEVYFAPLTTKKFVSTEVTVSFGFASGDPVELTKTGTSSSTTFTFTKTQIDTALGEKEPTTVTVTAAGYKADVSVAVNADSNLTVAASNTGRYGSAYAFTVEAKPGYEIVATDISDAADAMAAAITTHDYSSEDLIIYAVETGTALADADESQIYPVRLEANLEHAGVYDGTIIDNVENDSEGKGVLSNITIYIGTITKDATYDVANTSAPDHVASMLDGNDTTIIGYDTATHETDLAFTVTLDANNSSYYYVMRGLTYDVAGGSTGLKPSVCTIHPTTTEGEAVTADVVIAGSTITGDLSINVDASKIVTSNVTLTDGTSGEGIEADNFRYKIASGTEKNYTAAFGVETNKTLTIKATLKPGYVLAKEDVATNVANAFKVTSVSTNSSNVATIIGTFVGEADTEITLTPVAVHALDIDVTDPYNALTGLQYGYGATADAVANWTNYTETVSFRQDDEHAYVKFRYEVADDYAAEIIAGGEIAAYEPEDFETVDEWKTLVDGEAYEIANSDDQAKMDGISIDVSRTGTKAIAVYNDAPSTLTKVAVTVDTGTANEAYFTDYAKEKSTKSGVMKLSENVYTVYSAGGNTEKSSVMTIAVTAAANYKPTITAPALDASDYAVTQKGQVYTFAIEKTALLNNATITFGSTIDNGEKIWVEAPTASGGHFTVTASVDGVAVVETQSAEIDGVYTGDIYDIGIGKKVVFTITPDAGYTLSPGSLVKTVVSTDKTTNTAVNPTADGFSYTVTSTAGTIQKLRLVATPIIAAGAIGGETGTSKTSTSKLDSGEVQRLVTYTYNALEAETEYTPTLTVGGEEVTIAKVELLSGTGANQTKVAEEDAASINIPAEYANTSLTVRLTDDVDNVYTGFYTVKANRVLTSVKVSGVKTVNGTDVLYQEAGTIGTYGITITPSGATLSNVLAAVYEDDTLTALADVEEMDAEVNEDTKKLSVMMNVPADEAGYVALYKSADGSDAFDPAEDTFLTGFWAVTTDSKLKNTTPAVTLKGATDNSLKLSLALPSAAANSFKNRSYIEEFVYEIAYTKKSGTGAQTTSPYYVIATDTKQDAVVKVLDEDAGSGNPADFEVQVTVYAVSAITDSSDQDAIAAAIWTDPEDHGAGLATTCIEESKTTAAKTMSTLAVRYPTSLSVKAVNTTLYAGEKYSVTKAGTSSLDTDGNLILATITPDAKTTYAPVGGFTVEDVPTLDPLLTIDGIPVTFATTLGATIVDNGNGTFNLVIPNAKIDALKAVEMMTASKTCEVRVTAPAANAADQKVSATIKFTVNQRGVNGTDPNKNVGTDSIYATAATLNQTKKSGTALNVTLPLVYGNTTKAANNAWEWTFDTTSAVVDITSAVDEGTYYGFTAAELNAANALEGTKKGTGKNVSISQAGKLTLNKDFVFTDRTNKKALVTVKATSKYNPELALTYKVYFTDSTAIQAQGDLVIGVMQYETPNDPTSTAEGIQIIAQKGTAAMTTGEFFGLVDSYRNPAADPQNIFPQLYLLKQGAVISPSGFVDINYVVTDTALTSTSGNTKIADVWNNRVFLEGAAVGSVTFTAVPENTGVKKTVALSLKAATFQNTATAKDYYSLERVDDDDYTTLDEKANNLTANKYADKAATLAFTSATVNDNLFTLRVLKGTAELSGKTVTNPEAEAGELDAFYSNSLLKAGTGVSIDWSDQMSGLYGIVMYGKTGKVTVNGVTYTLTNPAKSDVAAGNITQAESAYANVDYVQTVKFAAASKIANVDGVKVELDYTDTKSVAFFAGYLTNAYDPLDPATFFVDDFTVNADDTVGNKHVTSFEMAFEGTMLPQGSYNFYATFLNGGAAITAPQKFTLKVGAAPSVSVKTAYTITLDGGAAKEFTLTDSKGNVIPTLSVTRVSNVLNTSTGADNNFVSLFDDVTAAMGETMTLQGDATLLSAPAANCTGFITYSVDGGVTEKTAKVTLSFVSSVEFYLAQLGTAVGGVDDKWSAEYVTNAKALTAIKGLIAMPSNINVSWQSFTPVTYDEGAMTGALGGTLLVKNTKDKNDPSDTLDVDLTIPAVTLTSNGADTIYGITELTYTAKDGGSKTITKTATVTADNVTFDVPLGTTVSITKMTADPAVSSTPDSYYVASDDANVVLEKKTGPWTLGIIYDDADDLTINTLSTITLTKGANIDKLKVTYKGSDGNNVVKADYTKPVNIKANTSVTVFATPKAGYDAVLTNSKTKAAIAVAGDSSNPGTGAEVKFTATAFNAATTLAATATAHLFNTSVTYGSQASSVYNKIEYNQTWGAKAGWTVVTSGETFTAPFGQSVQIRLTKIDGQTVGTKAGDWTVVATQVTNGSTPGTVIKGSEAAKLSNYTSKINGTTAITLVAGKNAALSLTNNANPKNAVASMQLSANGGTKAAYTSGSQKVLMEDTVYEFTLNVRKGYEPVVVDSEDSPVAVELASGSTYTGAVYTFGGTMTTDAAAYTVTAVKKTEIGQVNLGTGAPDADTAILAASWVTSGGEDVTLTVGTAQESEALIGDTISLTVVTNPGYDLQIQTQSPTQNATTWTTVKPGTAASAPLKLVTTASDGRKEWLYTVKAADTIARIALNPVAQARSYKVVNGDASKSITNMKVTIDSKSASLSGKSYYGAVLTITFDAPTSYSVTATGASFVSKTTNATTGKSNYKYTATLLTEGETFTFR